MGMISNAANAAAADAVAKQQEMQMLLRGKTSEQQAVIKFFMVPLVDACMPVV